MKPMKDETLSFYRAAVIRVVERIVAGLDEALDLEALARMAALSPFHFHRVFRGMLGETPLELHRRLRLERASVRLRGSDEGVTAIAFEAGYETHEAFTRAFRAAHGVPPQEFRRRGHARIELPTRSGVHFRSLAIHFETGGPAMNVSIVERPALRLAAVHHVGPYHQIANAFEQLGELAGPIIAHAQGMVAVYHDDPESTPSSELSAEAGLIVPEGVPLPEGLREYRVAGGTYAKTRHDGPYETLGDTWARFMGSWLPASDYRVGSGTTYEEYLNTPDNAKPADLRTELYLPISI